MSGADTETHAAIVAEMRRIKYYGEECTVKWCLTEWADRLEAAHKRELTPKDAAIQTYVAELEAERERHRSEVAQLREAVIAARWVLAVWGDELPFRAWNEKGEALDKCDAALREGGNYGNK